MDLTNIFVKTPKGVEEIEKRTHSLPLKLRSLLIMVNGKVSAADLIARGGTFGSGVEVLLKMLYEQGFIEPLSSARRAAAPAAPVFSEQQALQSARGVIGKSLLDLLGPDAGVVVEKLERCATKLQLLAYCDTCKDIVQSVAGKPKADEFWTRSRIAIDLAFSQQGPDVSRGPASAAPTALPAFDEKAALKQSQREISKVLHNYLGPDADYVVQRLEKTAGKVQLLAFCDTCKDIVESVIGKNKGAEVWNRSRQIIEKAFEGQVASVTVGAASAPPPGPPTPPLSIPAATAVSGPPTIPPSGPPTVPPWMREPGADGVKVLRATKQSLSKALLDIMGPEADFLLARLEKAKDLTELLNLATSCRNLVADTRGRSKADAFWATVRQFYPDQA